MKAKTYSKLATIVFYLTGLFLLYLFIDFFNEPSITKGDGAWTCMIIAFLTTMLGIILVGVSDYKGTKEEDSEEGL